MINVKEFLAEHTVIDDTATKCADCGRRKSKFVLNFYQDTGSTSGPSCIYCLLLWYTDIDNFCEKIDQPRNELVTEVYADGGLLAMNRIGGVFAWCGVTASGHRVMSERACVLETKLKQPVTNNHTEEIAIIRALEAMPEKWSGKVYSDSNVALFRVFWNGGSKNRPWIIEERAKNAVKRLGKLEPKLLQGHPTETDLIVGIGERRGIQVSIHNHFCDIQCELEKKEFFEANKELT